MDEITKKLFIAIRDENCNEIRKLILKGADLACENSTQRTAIQFAYTISLDCVKAIIESKNTDSQDSYRYGFVLLDSLIDHQFELATSLLKANASLSWRRNNDANNALHLSIKSHNTRPNFTLLDNTALIKRLLKSQDANLALSCSNTDNQTPLELACALGHWDCALLLLQDKGFVLKNQSKANTAYAEAIKAGQFKFISLFLKAGGSALETTAKGCTALHALTIHWNKIPNNSHYLQLLLKHEPSLLTLANLSGQTPIELASEYWLWDCVQELLDFVHPSFKDKVNPQLVDSLHLDKVLINAIKSGNYGMTKSLLDLGTSCNHKNSSMGNIALYWAAKENKADIFELLLAYGADPTFKTKEGKTTVDIAGAFKNLACLKHLQAYTKGMISLKKAPLLDLEALHKDRRRAAKLMQGIIDKAFTPQKLPSVIRKLATLHFHILEGDKLLLLQERKQFQSLLPLQTNAFFQSNGQCFPDRLTELVQIINTLLKSKGQAFSLNCQLDPRLDWELDISNYLSYQQNLYDYTQRVHQLLIEINQTIEKTQWKTVFFGMWVEGKPEPIDTMQRLLMSYFENANLEECLSVYEQVIKLFHSIPNLETRDKNTESFYQNLSLKLSNMTFWAHTQNYESIQTRQTFFSNLPTNHLIAQSSQHTNSLVPVYINSPENQLTVYSGY